MPRRPDEPLVLADWNVVVTAEEDGAGAARRFLSKWGVARRTHFYNVLALTVADPRLFLEQFGVAVAETPGLLNFIAHVMPAEAVFDFASPLEFEAKAAEIALRWVAALAGKRFHVRMHRRGFKGELSTPQEERFLDEALLKALEAAGTPGRIAFEDPDAVLLVQTIDGRAGLALWTRDELARFPFLGPR